MNTIKNIYKEALLAEASYANFNANADPFEALTTVDGKFSATQANDFLTHWEIVSQQANTASGFSATAINGVRHD